MSLWVDDPSTKKPSVSLTYTVVFGTALLIAGALEVAGVTKSTSIFLEAFVGTLATYLGRRLAWGGKTYSAELTNNNQGETTK